MKFLKRALWLFAVVFSVASLQLVKPYDYAVGVKAQQERSIDWGSVFGGSSVHHDKPRLAPGEKWVVHLKLEGAVGSSMAKHLIDEIKQVNKAGADVIVVEIDTPGGDVASGLKIVKAMEESRAPVQCVVDGEAASMGFYILQGCTTRMMTKHSLIMVHEPSISGVGGNQDDMLAYAERLAKLNYAMTEYEARRMNVTSQKLRDTIAHGHDWWMTWDDALAAGAIDGVVWSVDAAVDCYKHGDPPKYIR